MARKGQKIIQMIPATGWRTRYRLEGKEMVRGIAMFALYDDGAIIPLELTAGGDFREPLEAPGFEGYLSPHDL